MVRVAVAAVLVARVSGGRVGCGGARTDHGGRRGTRRRVPAASEQQPTQPRRVAQVGGDALHVVVREGAPPPLGLGGGGARGRRPPRRPHHRVVDGASRRLAARRLDTVDAARGCGGRCGRRNDAGCRPRGAVGVRAAAVGLVATAAPEAVQLQPQLGTRVGGVPGNTQG